MMSTEDSLRESGEVGVLVPSSGNPQSNSSSKACRDDSRRASLAVDDGEPLLPSPGLWKNPLIANILSPFSLVYGTASSLRLQAYASRLIQRRSARAPVVSVGNITVGGTGKTPVTVALATEFIQQGKRVGILSRGYKRKSKDPFTVVSDGNGILCDVASAGDEPYMMAKAIPSAVIVVGKDRAASAEIAVSQYGCDLLLLDDGFQHVRLARDVDIVLLDFNDDLSSEKLLPAGRLREPLSALGRATHVIVTKVPANTNRFIEARLDEIRTLVGRYAPGSSLSMCRFQPAVSMMSSPAKISGTRAVAVCGIARPEQFFRTLQNLDIEVVATHAFADHHEYGPRDAEALCGSLDQARADVVLTTEKDYYKLNEFENLEGRLGAVVLKTVWIEEPPEFKV